MKVVVIINKFAGIAQHLDANRREDYFIKLFNEVGIEAEIHFVIGSRITQLAREALKMPIDAVVVGGGDGTISAVANVLAKESMPLGILPLGTLNHFAKDFGIPLILEEAIAVIANGHIRACDVGQINSLVFINNSSIGLYPNIVKERDSQREQLGRNKWLAMLVATFSMIRRFPVVNIKLDIDGEPVTRISPFVFIGNNHYEMNLLTLGSRRHLDKGELSLYIANRTGRLGLFRLALMTILGRLNQAQDFDMISAKKICIETRRKRVRIALDGEVRRLKPPLNYEIMPQALNVFAPLEQKP